MPERLVEQSSSGKFDRLTARAYWLMGGIIAICVCCDFALMSWQLNWIEARTQAYTHVLDSYRNEFDSDIDQHDRRIKNNSDNIRTLLRMLGEQEIDAPIEDLVDLVEAAQ